MAGDVTTAQTLLNSARHLVMRFTDVSDGTGETDVLKVDALSAANGWVIQGQTIVPATDLKIVKIRYACVGMGVRIRWQATAPADILALQGFGEMDFSDIGGIQAPTQIALPGVTGSILFSTIAAANGASYTVELFMTKGTGGVLEVADLVLIELEDGSGVWEFEDGSLIAWG